MIPAVINKTENYDVSANSKVKNLDEPRITYSISSKQVIYVCIHIL